MFYKKAVHPCLLFAVSSWNQNRILFSDAIAQPASVRCSSRVWVFPTSILQSKISRCIYVCIACNNYEASQCDFQIWKLFSNQDRPFSSSTWSGRLFFCSGSFCICNHSKQGELVPTRNFWIWFYKSDFKNTCWASPKPDVQHKNALVSHLNDRWISKFLGEKFVFGKSSLIHLILHKTGTITSGFEGKKRK